MNAYIVVATLIAFFLFSIEAPAQSLDKLAVANTQRTLASEIDAGLPRLSFGDWFEKAVGPGAGVVWQLSECGERGEGSPQATRDIPVCVEANAMLADGRRVILMTAIGTFKNGVIGAPAFRFGVIEQGGELYPIKRLRDLGKLLSEPGNLTKRPAVKLPEINAPKVKPAMTNAYMPALPALLGWDSEESGRLMAIEDPPPPPPPPTATPVAENRPESEASGQTISREVNSGSISGGEIIKRAQASYPIKAKKMNAAGPVSVRITISETGHVIEAKAISGHPLLREAAEEAARQFVFEPLILSGAAVKTETTLVFVFKVPE